MKYHQRLASVLIVFCITMISMERKAQAAPGNLDFTFGMEGMITTNIDLIFSGVLGFSIGTTDLAIYPPGDSNSGKIVAVGGGGSPVKGAVSVYLSDGSLDTSFGINGVIEDNFGDSTFYQSVAVYPPGDINAGKILVTGSVDVVDQELLVARYCPNGDLDTGATCGSPGFGSAGIFTTTFGGGAGANNEGNGIAIQPDGKIVVAGYSNANGPIGFALLRLNSDGSLDSSFNPSGPLPGTVITNIGASRDQANAVAIHPVGDPNVGKIVLAGNSYNGSDTDFILARYCPDGSLDTGACGGASFGGTGIVAPFPATGTDQINDLAIQADGKIIGAGFEHPLNHDNWVLLRVCGDGAVDDGSTCGSPGFGSGGIAILDFNTYFAPSDEVAQVLALQVDGKIIGLGTINSPALGDLHFMMGRFLPNGDLDGSFGTDRFFSGLIIGGPIAQSSNRIDDPRGLALQPDGKIVVSGTASFNDIFMLARFLGDEADLSLSKTVSVSPATGGSPLTYTLVVTNHGPLSASGITVTDTLPDSVTLESAPGCTGTLTLSCPVPTLANGESSESITITVNTTSSSLVSNTATVSGAVTDPESANNTATAEIDMSGLGSSSNGGCALNAEVIPNFFSFLGFALTLGALGWRRLRR